MRRPYDLMLLLDPEAPEERHGEILSETESIIGAGGELTTKQDWGRRRMTFEIDHRPEAAYHLIQFDAEPSVLERLRSTLRIADGVLRFRIIRVKPGAPPPTPPRPETRHEEQEEPEGRVAARAAADAPDPAQADQPEQPQTEQGEQAPDEEPEQSAAEPAEAAAGAAPEGESS